MVHVVMETGHNIPDKTPFRFHNLFFHEEDIYTHKKIWVVTCYTSGWGMTPKGPSVLQV